MDMQNMQYLPDFQLVRSKLDPKVFNPCWAAPRGAGGSSVAPFYIRRAEDFMHRHLPDQLCVEDIAAYAGVSARTLYAGFRTYRKSSVMAYLRDLRLDRVQEELEGSQVSVTEAAIRWGFSHLGRFSKDYKQRFGLLPSMVQRRRNDEARAG